LIVQSWICAQGKGELGLAGTVEFLAALAGEFRRHKKIRRLSGGPQRIELD
jgi:hypothetical protein